MRVIDFCLLRHMPFSCNEGCKRKMRQYDRYILQTFLLCACAPDVQLQVTKLVIISQKTGLLQLLRQLLALP